MSYRRAVSRTLCEGRCADLACCVVCMNQVWLRGRSNRRLRIHTSPSTRRGKDADCDPTLAEFISFH